MGTGKDTANDRFNALTEYQKENYVGAQAYYNDTERTIYYNETRTWYKDLYNLMWDLDLKENVYMLF